jgi:hypothetical protein
LVFWVFIDDGFCTELTALLVFTIKLAPPEDPRPSLDDVAAIPAIKKSLAK